MLNIIRVCFFIVDTCVCYSVPGEIYSEVYALFLSDVHVGSNNFLGERFSKFIKWLNGDIGNESQRDIVKKFIVMY